MAVTKPIIFIIHGAWHTPENYSKLTTALKIAGYEVHVPALPSANESRPPNADLYTDTSFVRGYVKSLIDAGRTIVVLMHSYGGHVGTNALYGLGLQDQATTSGSQSGGVSHLIYMCSFALPEGAAMTDRLKELGHEHLLPLAIDFAEDNSCVSRDPKVILINPDPDDAKANAEADIYVSLLRRWNGKAMYQALTNCAWRAIPVTYIFTTRDMTVSLDTQKWIVEELRAEGRRLRLSSWIRVIVLI